jgi:hypothetical protein
MELLDATLAFVLTLAALATVVTVVMEAVHRILRVRKGNLIIALQRLNKEIPKGPLRVDPRRRWDFIVNVLNNPTAGLKQQLPTSQTLTKEADDQKKHVPTVFGARNEFRAPEKSRGEEAWNNAIDSLGRQNGVRGIYDKVSLEHVLRRFVEVGGVKTKIEGAREAAEAELNRIARKYEEFASAVSADFKRRAQLWSMVVGIVLALVANTNGVRIFETYMKNQDLAARVIGQFEEFEKQALDAQESLKKVRAEEEQGGGNSKELDAKIEGKRKELSDLRTERTKADAAKNTSQVKSLDKQIEDKQKEYDSLVAKRYAASEAGKAEAAMKDAAGKLRALSELGVPIGTGYFPHLLIFGGLSKEEKQKRLEAEGMSDLTPWKWFLETVFWFFATAITGMLIGLGGPFWFDVAKRLTEVRSMFKGTPSDEIRLSGKEAGGDTKKRKELVKDVVEDVISEQRSSAPSRDLLNPPPPEGPVRKGGK